MKSTLLNMSVVLFCITLIASAGVGVVNMTTKEPIAAAESAAATELIAQVLPEGAAVEPADTLLNVDGNIVTVSRGVIENKIAGYAVSAPSLTVDGFSGKVILMVGFKPDGAIYNIRVLKQTETPGLGTNMELDGNKLYASFFDKTTGEGKNPSQMQLAVTKDGGEVDILTAATISSRAYVNAVATAYAAYQKVAQEDAVEKIAEEDIIESNVEPLTLKGSEDE